MIFTLKHLTAWCALVCGFEAATPPYIQATEASRKKIHSGGSRPTAKGVGHAARAAPEAAVITLGGEILTAHHGQFVHQGHTLTPGGEIYVNGKPVSLDTHGFAAYRDGTTYPLVHATIHPTHNVQVFTFAGFKYTENSVSHFVVHGQTLTRGGKITVSETPISLKTDASHIIIAGKTQVVGHVTAPAGTHPASEPVGSHPTSALTGKHPSPTSAGKHPASTPTEKHHDSPSAKHPASTSAKKPSGSTEGLTIAGFTTIGKARKPAGSFPTAGSGAIDALKPLASSALGALRNAQSAAKHLSQNHNPTSGDVMHIGGLLSSAFKDLDSLGAAAGDIELKSFSGEDLEEATETTLGIQNLRGFVKVNAEGIGPWLVSNSRGLSQLPKLATQLASIAGIGTLPLVAIIKRPQKTKLTHTNRKADHVSLIFSSSTSKSTAWILNTIPGTPLKVFDEFIKTLPDKGTGRRIVYPHLSDQCYIGSMTLAQAKLVSKIPIVDQLALATGKFKHAGMGTREDFMNRTGFSSTETNSMSGKQSRLTAMTQFWKLLRQKRSPAFTVMRRGDSETVPYHLTLLSLWKESSLFVTLFGPHDTDTGGYLYEEKAGEGSFVYVLDSGFDRSHPEFDGILQPETYTARAPQTMPGVNLGPPTEDYVGHGSGMASMIVGAVNGVVPRAKLVVVKIADWNAPNSGVEFVVDGWRWAINDIVAKRRQGKASISMSWTVPYGIAIDNNGHVNYADWRITPPRRSDYWLPLLTDSWRNDIVTVVPCGNIQFPGQTIGEFTPHRYGRPDNPLITVGSLESIGYPAITNCLEGPSRNGMDPLLKGSISIYAAGVDIQVPNAPSFLFNDWVLASGSSYAVPQVAGLAGYIATSPAFAHYHGGRGKVSMARKNQLLNLKRRNMAYDSVGAAYNGIREINCALVIPAQRKLKKARDIMEPAPMLESMTNETSLEPLVIERRYPALVFGPHLFPSTSSPSTAPAPRSTAVEQEPPNLPLPLVKPTLIASGSSPTRPSILTIPHHGRQTSIVHGEQPKLPLPPKSIKTTTKASRLKASNTKHSKAKASTHAKSSTTGAPPMPVAHVDNNPQDFKCS